MKNIIVVPFLFLLSLSTYCQNITGIVLDSKTGDTIQFANVYFSGTFTGTHTDKNGRFSIDISGMEIMPLTISAVGYYSVTISRFPKSDIMVLLEPKIYEMKEIVVNAESLLREREANLRIFRREFLGSSIYGKRCRILNEKDITFNYGQDADTLRAYAKNIIRIHNPLLGYKIACFLDDFRYSRLTGGFFMTGFILFEQDLIDSTDLKKIARRRKHAYLGSAMHFFRSLWTDNLKVDGFNAHILSDYIKGKNLYKKVVVESDSLKYFHSDGFLILSYQNNLTEVKFLSEMVPFDKTGQYDFTKIAWNGKMAEMRLGDWLPLEYKP